MRKGRYACIKGLLHHVQEVQGWADALRQLARRLAQESRKNSELLVLDLEAV